MIMVKSGLFNRKWTFLAIAVIAIIFIAMVYYSFEDKSKSGGSREPDFLVDRSPIGKTAFIEFLKLSGYEINPKPLNQIVPADYDSTLVIYFLSERDSVGLLRDHFLQVAAGKSPLLIVPKWILLSGKKKEVDTLPRSKINELVNAVCNTNGANTIMNFKSDSWASDFDRHPNVKLPQLISLGGLKPVIADNGIVFYGNYAGASGGSIHLLADPDLVSNYGIKNPVNAALALAIVRSLTPEGIRSITVSNHGYGAGGKTKNPVTALFKFPVNIILINFLLLVAALVWMGRWKSMKAQDSQKPSNRKEQLIRAFGGYFSFGKINNKRIAQRYLQIRTRQTATLLAAPTGMDDKQQADWLKKFSSLKKTGDSFEGILKAIAEAPENMSETELLRIAKSLFSVTEKLIKK